MQEMLMQSDAEAVLGYGGPISLDQVQLGSIPIAQEKAIAAVKFKKPTIFFEYAIAEGGLGLRLLSSRVICPLEGGLPLTKQGEVIGGIGASGMTSTEDVQVATAGAMALHE